MENKKYLSENTIPALKSKVGAAVSEETAAREAAITNLSNQVANGYVAKDDLTITETGQQRANSLGESIVSKISKFDYFAQQVVLRVSDKNLATGEEKSQSVYLSVANSTGAGAMSASDKKKLDALPAISSVEQTTGTSETAVMSQKAVSEALSQIPKFAIQVVDTLPTADISNTTVYLVPSGEEAQNLYTEYIYVNNKWEKLGTQTVDLTDYSTTEQMNAAIVASAETKQDKLTDADFMTVEEFNAAWDEAVTAAEVARLAENNSISDEAVPDEEVAPVEENGEGVSDDGTE